MNFQVDVLFPGFPGKLTAGGIGWGAMALVRDGKHNILIDAGGTTIRTALKGLLAKHGLTYGDIDIITLSHLHYDHVYNIDYFPHALFVFSKQEWEYANRLEEKDYNIEEKAITLLRSFRTMMIEKDGDEIVPGMTAILTPGHTDGCMSVVLDQGNGEKWLFSGDAAKNRGEIAKEDFWMTLDPEVSKQSVRKMKRIATRILPGHDGWLTIKNGEVIPEGGNDFTFVFEQGLTVNGGLTELTLRLD